MNEALETALLAGTRQDEPATMRRLSARLSGAADAAGLLDVAWRTMDSPLGPLLLAATDRGLVRVAFDVEDPALALRQLAKRIGPRILEAPWRLDAVARQLDEYFTGRRTRFQVPVDLVLLGGPFRRLVVGHLPEIPFGATASYAQLASDLGSPRATRAVGTACASNPVPVVIPCHRVIRTDGTIGSYLGGTAAKRWLLDHESTD